MCCLHEQDQFISDHLTAEDYLVVSVGGNDVVLKPVLLTCLNMVLLTNCIPQVPRRIPFSFLPLWAFLAGGKESRLALLGARGCGSSCEFVI